MSQQNHQSTTFELSADAQEISVKLEQALALAIEDNAGSLPFSSFMNHALYEPQLGYYQNKLHKFGEKGDFVTAPEMGGLFAQCLANSLANIFHDETLDLLEIGAGSGALAVELLRRLEVERALPKNYFILEPSASLQVQQKESIQRQIPQLFERCTWLANLPKDFQGVVVANEVVDAMPCDIVEKTADGWSKVLVTRGEEPTELSVNNASKFCEILSPPLSQDEVDNELPLYLTQHWGELPIGYRAEIRPVAKPWINSLGQLLKKGVILIIDYGYPQPELYHPQRTQGSLTCFINHHRHSNPYQYVGLQDITAHVDFTELAIAATQADLEVDGFTTQAGFLLENGLATLTEESQKAEKTENSEKAEGCINDQHRFAQSRQMQKLLMPGQMGEVIKVMSLSKDWNQTIPGFSLQDHLHRL